MKLNAKLFSSLLITSAMMVMPGFAQEATDAPAIPSAFEVAAPSGGEFDVAIAPPSEVIAFGLSRGMGGGHCGLLSSLNLTDEQMEKLVSLKDKDWMAVAAKKAEMQSLMHQLVLAMTDAKVDRSKAMALHKKIDALKSDLCEGRFNLMLDCAEVLTEEQRKTARHAMLTHQLMGSWAMGKMMHHGRHH